LPSACRVQARGYSRRITNGVVAIRGPDSPVLLQLVFDGNIKAICVVRMSRERDSGVEAMQCALAPSSGTPRGKFVGNFARTVQDPLKHSAKRPAADQPTTAHPDDDLLFVVGLFLFFTLVNHDADNEYRLGAPTTKIGEESLASVAPSWCFVLALRLSYSSLFVSLPSVPVG